MNIKYGKGTPSQDDTKTYTRYIDLVTNTTYDVQNGEWVMVAKHGVPVDKYGNPLIYRFGY